MQKSGFLAGSDGTRTYLHSNHSNNTNNRTFIRESLLTCDLVLDLFDLRIDSDAIFFCFFTAT